MSTLPKWLEEKRNAVAQFFEHDVCTADPEMTYSAPSKLWACGADWMYYELREEMKVLVDALIAIQTEINKPPYRVNEDSLAIPCNEALARHKEKFP